MSFVKCLIAVLLALFVLPAFAGKLYKIVDENGNVTFSQFPPKEKSENVTVEDVEVSSGGKASIREVGNRIYCGDILVYAREHGDSDKYAARRSDDLREKMSDWQDRLNQLQRRADQRSRSKLSIGGGYNISDTATINSYYQNLMEEDAKQMRELRCAIAWAEDTHAKELGVASVARAENSRLRDEQVGLERKMTETCGREPLLNPSDPANARDRRQWRACTKSFRKGLSDVDDELQYR